MRTKASVVLAVSLAFAACTDAPTAVRSAPANTPRHGTGLGTLFWTVEKQLTTVNGATVDPAVPVVVPAGQVQSLGFTITVNPNFSSSPGATLDELASTACDGLPAGFICSVDAPVGSATNNLALRDFTFPHLSGGTTITVTINVRNPDVCGADVSGIVTNRVRLVSDDGVEATAEASAVIQAATCVTPPAVSTLGCSPGYWKNHNFPTGYGKNQLFFGTASGGSAFANAFPNLSLQQVLAKGGGGLTALGRQTVGAYFNAVSLPGFPYTPKQIIDKFNAASAAGAAASAVLQSQFESLTDINGRTCPNPTGK